jgi:hypothetical protein
LATVLVVEAKERERVLAGQQPRAPPLPRVQLKNDKQFFFQDPLGFREGEVVQISFPPLGRLTKEGKGRERRIGKARVH